MHFYERKLINPKFLQLWGDMKFIYTFHCCLFSVYMEVVRWRGPVVRRGTFYGDSGVFCSLISRLLSILFPLEEHCSRREPFLVLTQSNDSSASCPRAAIAFVTVTVACLPAPESTTGYVIKAFSEFAAAVWAHRGGMYRSRPLRGADSIRLVADN